MEAVGSSETLKKFKVEGKSKFHLRTGHEDPEGEYRYNITLSLTSAVDVGGWSTLRPGRFNPGKDSVPIVKEAGWSPEPVWTGAEKLAPTRIRSPDRLGCSKSLYGLRYPGSLKKHTTRNYVITQPIEIKYLDDTDSLGFIYGVQFSAFF
jgi:hypothetical protein